MSVNMKYIYTLYVHSCGLCISGLINMDISSSSMDAFLVCSLGLLKGVDPVMTLAEVRIAAWAIKSMSHQQI